MKALGAGLLAVSIGLLGIGCHRGKEGNVTEELAPQPPESWTSHMVLMVSISDDGRIATKVMASGDGRFVLVDIPSKKVTRLTRDGSATLLNGELDWVYPGDTVPEFERAYQDLKAA